MKRSKFTDSQILSILKQAEGGTPVSELCREHVISAATFYKWRAKFGGMDKNQIRLVFIQPGNPQQNAYIERYNRTVRYDWLSQYLFESIAEVQLHATQWLWTYNNERPNTAIGGIPPRQKLALVA
ncbi:putative transposase OrfB [Legionella massiliensis]|uniref:Putative transposase OrfB n=2 Tax=Legionella massiliensis TaxID=1034943 RepID=A0A078KRT1_9GAMM|nr:integrase core domain-containing protein [Legionella massiliensis]CDZ75801.1 putative transposase OrfB [Legionella massiliensis]CEE11539.1 Transposase [Legionella massiliensis]